MVIPPTGVLGSGTRHLNLSPSTLILHGMHKIAQIGIILQNMNKNSVLSALKNFDLS